MATSSAGDGNIPWHQRSTERVQCWGMGTGLSRLPWDELTKASYYPFATREDCKSIKCGTQQKGMKTDNDNVLKKENTTLRFPSFNNGDSVQQLVATMPADHALREWELHTLEDMRWNGNHQRPIKYWSRDIIKSVRGLMRQAAYAEHLIYAPQHVSNSDTPPKRLYTQMPTADWWWETQISRNSQG